MDWTTYCNGFWWIFPLLGLLFMAVMMLACRGMLPRCGHACGKADAPQGSAPRPMA